ncbi:chaperone protein DNAj, putative [Trypanosoma brucei gambiense DAL972]|uniref:Chaperone protein DNAj, putative n=1 Tax=Trypanosoma brucei gambiense (strain MHOM/CI/86/DAL972) TaxID=679716 RepID=D0A566_TRYB9|nr:chaperone protein DNAj, putative [Trypanosoma brucei gambiense DAL972]CBH16410.1 chaperone protein DNAj, putative [Trypanosoma brucei gambiense DAL972]|eukprot:XP_011778674.1 chaperone protein DNAj, putative [Trypanosoma brucei gambiense DAL972]
MDIDSPYKILGIPQSASVADIRAAFRRLALTTHPDKQGSNTSGGEAQMMLYSSHPFYVIKEASDILLDPVRRAEYDEGQQRMYARSIGVVSDVHDISDFRLVEERKALCSEDRVCGDVTIQVYEMECRCGGAFEIFLVKGEEGNVDKLCGCDSCSLIVSVRRQT